jgi:hypothetical protein
MSFHFTPGAMGLWSRAAGRPTALPRFFAEALFLPIEIEPSSQQK